MQEGGEGGGPCGLVLQCVQSPIRGRMAPEMVVLEPISSQTLSVVSLQQPVPRLKGGDVEFGSYFRKFSPWLTAAKAWQRVQGSEAA